MLRQTFKQFKDSQLLQIGKSEDVNGYENEMYTKSTLSKRIADSDSNQCSQPTTANSSLLKGYRSPMNQSILKGSFGPKLS